MFVHEFQNNCRPQKLPTPDALGTILNEAYDKISANFSIADIYELANSLAHQYDVFNAEGRLEHFRFACQSHPLQNLILEDPYARRAFEKPRGYAGDAVMLDYIYQPGHDKHSASGLNISPTGRTVHEATTRLPSAKSIIWRRRYLAERICSTAERTPHCRILSVACGHMRELDLVRRDSQRRDFNIIALDQDGYSLVEAASSYGDFNITCVNKSFSYLLRGNQRGQRFSLIYSAGLFDYLSDRSAKVLIRTLHGSLVSGGLLTIGNFTPRNHGRGFMEGFMDWSLIYRDEQAMVSLVRDAVPSARYNTFEDEYGNVAYVEVWKT